MIGSAKRAAIAACFILCSAPAFAEDTHDAPDTTSAAVADCSASGLAKEAVDACIERVRLLEETDSSQQLQALEVALTRTDDQTADYSDMLSKTANSLGFDHPFPPRARSLTPDDKAEIAAKQDAEASSVIDPKNPDIRAHDDTGERAEIGTPEPTGRDFGPDVHPSGDIPEDEETRFHVEGDSH
jgi:hypothetical protein